MKHSIKTSYLKRGYGQFPYIIIRITSCLYQQIPLHSKGLRHKGLDGLYVNSKCQKITDSYQAACELTFMEYWISKKNKGCPSDMCLVTNKNRALFITKEGSITIAQEIPSGGILQALDNTFIQMNGEHYICEL